MHYQAYGTPGGEFKSVPRAACITEVFSDTEVMVFVMNPGGLFPIVSVTAKSQSRAAGIGPRVIHERGNR